MKQLDGRQQELVRDNYELKDLCLYLDEERNCIDLKCPHCGEKILSRPGSVVPPDDDEAVTQRLMDHKSEYIHYIVQFLLTRFQLTRFQLVWFHVTRFQLLRFKQKLVPH